MTLDQIPDGSGVLIDANVLIYARRGMSEQCRRLLARCGRGEIVGWMSTVILAEFCHRRMMQEAQARGLAGANPVKILSNNSEIILKLTTYRNDVEDLLSGELNVIPIAKSHFARALEMQSKFGLLTNDALSIAAGFSSGVSSVATCDSHFERVAGIQVYRPDDLSS